LNKHGAAEMTRSEPETSAVASPAIPRDAVCSRCGYSLFALETFRCPECGQTFDPADQSTMWMGRPAGRISRFLISPVGLRVRWLIMLECTGVIWGFAWLPGAYIVSNWSLAALMVSCAYAAARGIVRFPLRMYYGRLYRRPEVNDRALRRFSLVLLALCIASFFDLPLRANLFISRPFFMRQAMHAWTELPAISARVEPGIYGLLVVDRGYIGANGVSLSIYGANYDEIYVTEEHGEIVVVPRRRYYPRLHLP
jgi:hypothetical protein